jgi:hypothetical protein
MRNSDIIAVHWRIKLLLFSLISEKVNISDKEFKFDLRYKIQGRAVYVGTKNTSINNNGTIFVLFESLYNRKYFKSEICQFIFEPGGMTW